MAKETLRTATFIGPGRSDDYRASGRGKMLIEHEGHVYEIPPAWMCRRCEGAGCRTCRHTGNEGGIEIDYPEPPSVD